MKIIFGYLLTLFLACLNVQAQVADKTIILYSGNNVTSSVNGSAFDLSRMSGNKTVFIARLTYNKDSGTDPTLAVELQHQPKTVSGTCTGTAWKSLESFTSLAPGTSGTEDIYFAGDAVIYPCIRAVSTLGGTSPQYDIKVEWSQN